MQVKALLLSAVVALVMLSPAIEAYSSGKHNSSGGCGCHSSVTSVTISENFPTSYTPGQVYSIQISASGSVSGSKGGFNVEVNKGTLATGGNSGVKVSGNSITHSNKASRTWAFDWTAPSAGSGSVSVGIAAMIANGASTSGDAWTAISLTITETVVVTNSPPVATDVQLTPVHATSSDNLMLSYTFNDPDAGDTESGTTIHWSKNGIHQTQHDGLLTLSNSHTVRGDEWQVSITPSDGQDFGATEHSDTITVLNSPPIIGSVSLTPANPTSDDDVAAAVIGQNDQDGDSLTFEYRWYLGGNLQDGLNNLTVLPSYATRNGDMWEVEVRANDGQNLSSWVRSVQLSIGGQASNTPPAVTSVTLSPTNPTTIDSLEVSLTSTDAESDTITDTHYRWLKDGLMTGITSSSIDSVLTTKGESWVVEARVYDGMDWSSWVASSPVMILNTAPTLETVTISTTEAFTDENITLDALMSDADEDSLTMRIKWYLDGVLQPEIENEATLSSMSTSKGNVWTAVVQAYDGEEQSSQSQTLSVSILNSAPIVTLGLNEEVTSQDNLSLTTEIVDADDDAVEIVSIEWLRNSFREGALDGETVVPASYLGPGQEWSVEVVVSDGEATVLSESSVVVENAAPIAQILVLTEKLYAGERVVLTGSQSFDPDNSIVAYQWSWASGSSTGVELSLLMPESNGLEITLVVTDASGAINSTTTTLNPIPALSCPVLTSAVSGHDVVLSWTWTSSELATFEVTRNGVLIGVTNATTFSDAPSLFGVSSYQIQTILGDRVLEASCQSPITNVVLEGQLEDIEQGPSAVAGLGLGLAYGVIGILLFTLGLLRGRRQI